MTYLRPLAPACALAAFAYWFNPGQPQWWVDGLWVLAIVLWAVEIRLRSGRGSGVSPTREQVIPIAAFLAVYAALWLPFYNDWRWAYTGDSIAWYMLAHRTARDGFGQDILSLNGVDGNFTFLHSLAFNGLMFVFEPNLWWHRVGKLIVSSLSLIAIYTYFTMLLGRWWGLAVAAGTATNYVWLWFSYLSYGHSDSHIFYFGSLVCATLIWRAPDRLTPWMRCGLLGGLAVFFTQTSWSAVMLVGLWLGLYGLATRRIPALIVYGLSFLLVTTPILLQFSTLLDMTTRQAKSIYEWNYLVGIFMEILRFPYTSEYRHIAVYRGFMRGGLGQLYVAGAWLAALGILPPLRRGLRLPVAAPIVLGLLLWDTTLMTLTNNGYGHPSTKRAYSIIPHQIFLALLPFYVGYAWTQRWAWARRMVAAGAVGVLAAGCIGGLDRVMFPSVGLYGNNAFDGLIELRQRFADRPVLFLTSRPDYVEALGPSEFFNRNYDVLATVSVSTEFNDAAVEHVCAQHGILCGEPHYDHERFNPLREANAARLRPLPLLNSKELICYECSGAGTAPK